MQRRILEACRRRARRFPRSTARWWVVVGDLAETKTRSERVSLQRAASRLAGIYYLDGCVRLLSAREKKEGR